MKYLEKTFTLPVSSGSLSDLEYALRVGKITPEEFEVELNHASGQSKTTEGDGDC